ncbi:M20 family metallopeptidase [Kribbella speibonae]|uniref:Probable succinyl-diaminopimelate desuccinylase n=1 Tax=Kribbella speibonae TaxID=1572660 RepID=A0A4R0IW48_9ACTN|nr:M20 family metallopeptidase [Kribbella speibonae]TCC23774.1 M20 family peptidase [Kribbella speibonae]TCC38181.1 M20 family peptidase [Kribbella speibonae]
MSLTPAEQKVLDRIDEDLLVRIAQDLVRAPGQNPPGEEAATVAALTAAGRDLGLDVRTSPVEPGRDNVSITLAGGNDPGLLLLGHTDVVPVGDGWTVDPYGGLLRDGRIYGRGASDMKGGLAAALGALAALRDTELSGPVELVAVVDEEETGKGIRAYIADPNRRYAGCITAEPTDLQTIIAARGDSYLQVSVHGRASHAGNPDGGANAIYGAAAVVAEIERLHKELAAAPHPLLGPATWSVGQINGGTGGSIVPADCVIVADRRLLPGESPAEVLADLGRRVAALHLEDRGLTVELAMPMEMPAFETPEDADLVRITEAARFDAGGPPLPLAGWTAACDGGYIARDLGVPVVVLGPGSVTTQAHRADESVAVAELVTAARAYALTALRLL